MRALAFAAIVFNITRKKGDRKWSARLEMASTEADVFIGWLRNQTPQEESR